MRKIASAFVAFAENDRKKIIFQKAEIKHIFLLTALFYVIDSAIRRHCCSLVDAGDGDG